MTKKKVRNTVKLGVLNIFFIILCLATLLPVLYAFSVSINSNNSLLSTEFSFIPSEFTLTHYQTLLTEYPIILWFKNSIILSVCTLAISLAVAIPAAYMFSRKNFPGRKSILKILLLLYSFPSILSMFALYRVLSLLGLVNNKLGLILIYSGTMAIFGLWNLKGYFDTIPKEIEEAAYMDGATSSEVVRKMVLPLAKPAIVVTAIMILIYVWNEYIFSMTFMTGEQEYTLAVGLYSLQATEMSGSWPIFTAAAIAISVPLLIIFLISQKYMQTGLTAGSVKG